MNLIIDGNNLAHRCKHTFSLSYKGKDVSVIFGFLKVLSSWLKMFTTSSVIVCWDGGTPEFRRQRVPTYKTGRDKGDPLEYESFILQIQELADYALPLMGVISVCRLGAEADDLMYHASRLLVEPSIIITTDSDLLQAVSDTVSVYSPRTKDSTLVTPDVFKETFGVEPPMLVHMKALAGDTSDNVHGVRGIGMKTAIKLFKKYGSLVGIVNAANGKNPVGKIGGVTGGRISEFGLDRMINNVSAMNLHFDLVGAKEAVLTGVEDFEPTSKARVKKYLLRNAFSSLISSGFVGRVSKLCKPIVDTSNVRIPVVCRCRKPVP